MAGPDAEEALLVEPGGMATQARRILVGYDGSEASVRALDAAADLLGYGSSLAVVTVRTQAIAETTGATAREHLLRRHVEARYHDSAGEPAEELVAKARELDADLIVIGRRSRSPLRALLGSVSARVVRRAHCDVLVVR